MFKFLKEGIKTTEFWLVLFVGLFAILSATGLLSSARLNKAAANMQDTFNALPALADVLNKLFDTNGPLLIFAGSVWAYIKRRDSQKQRSFELAKMEQEKQNNEALVKLRGGLIDKRQIEVVARDTATKEIKEQLERIHRARENMKRPEPTAGVVKPHLPHMEEEKS